MMPQFPSVSTYILLIKNQLKLESRAIAVGVAMSPRNLGGKYRCRPHPRSHKCTRQFLREEECVNQTAPERRHPLTTMTTSSIITLWCVQRLNFCGTLSFQTKMTSYSRMVYIHAWTGRYVFWWDLLFDEGLASVQAGVPSYDALWRDAPLMPEFQMWGHRCKQRDSHWFQVRKMRFCGIWSTMFW